MLTDKQVIPLCEKWARRFLRQAMVFNPTKKEAYDELYNISYMISKPLNKINGASTWIMWKLIEYLEEKKKDPKASTYLRYVRRYKKEAFDESDPSIEVIVKEEKMNLIQGMRKLNSLELRLIRLRFKEEMTFEQIGKIFGWGRRWTSIKIEGILDKLRGEMGE